MTKQKYFFQLLLLLSLRPILGQHSSELESGSTSQIRCLESERQALLNFKEKLVDGYGRFSTWGIEENKRDCCKWKGVHCHNRTNHVTQLDLGGPFVRGPFGDGYLASAPLQGEISNSLNELQHLNYIDLSFNLFYAPIPEFIGSLKKLRYLNLSHVHCYGSIPHNLGNLSNLQYLDLGDTDLYSKNLEWLTHLHALQYLNLNNVNLSMATNWLQAISKLNSIKELHLAHTFTQEILPSSPPFINASTTLTVLDLSFNGYISSLTFRWISNFSSLTFIDLSANNLRGPIPDAFDNLMSLEHLDLSFNYLEGGVPKSIGNISSLIHLDVLFNSLTGQLSEVMMNWSGSIESKLQYLDLGWNMISGSFPDVVRFPSLKFFRLRKNQLSGPIPERCLQLPNLLVLDLSENNLIGPLPDLSFCSSLKVLILDSNKFNGTLTKSIRGLSKLETLSLRSNLLEDVITEAHMFNLSRLQILDLSSNSLLNIKFSHQWVPPFQLKYASLSTCILGPQFPKWIQNQKKLIYLDIANASISDTIPSWFGHLAFKLTRLNVSNNQIFCSFPTILFLDLSRNNISGSLTFLCHTPCWGFLDLSDNQFSNQLPECFANFESLEYLNLANNNLSGKIPDSFGSLGALSLLHLQNNSFSGEIPTSLKKCKNLQMIDLGENRLTGKIPVWIGESFSQLAFLGLSSNEFFGSIPSSICTLQTLQILDLSSNNISGAIPKCLCNLTAMTTKKVQYQFYVYNLSLDISETMDNKIWNYYSLDSANFVWKGNEVKYRNNLELVKLIDLSNNNLYGEIPAEITELHDLIGLNFSWNSLTGSIPQSIGELKSLDFLDLSRNHLSGGIPIGLSELGYLGTLDLSYNNLSGKIPQNSHMLTFKESAYTGNPELCGHPLNKSCPGDDDSNFNDDGNAMNNREHEEEDDKLITGGFYIAMGFGFVIGFWGIFGKIFFNKSVRFAF